MPSAGEVHDALADGAHDAKKGPIHASRSSHSSGGGAQSKQPRGSYDGKGRSHDHASYNGGHEHSPTTVEVSQDTANALAHAAMAIANPLPAASRPKQLSAPTSPSLRKDSAHRTLDSRSSFPSAGGAPVATAEAAAAAVAAANLAVSGLLKPLRRVSDESGALSPTKPKGKPASGYTSPHSPRGGSGGGVDEHTGGNNSHTEFNGALEAKVEGSGMRNGGGGGALLSPGRKASQQRHALVAAVSSAFAASDDVPLDDVLAANTSESGRKTSGILKGAGSLLTVQSLTDFGEVTAHRDFNSGGAVAAAAAAGHEGPMSPPPGQPAVISEEPTEVHFLVPPAPASSDAGSASTDGLSRRQQQAKKEPGQPREKKGKAGQTPPGSAGRTPPHSPPVKHRTGPPPMDADSWLSRGAGPQQHPPQQQQPRKSLAERKAKGGGDSGSGPAAADGAEGGAAATATAGAGAKKKKDKRRNSGGVTVPPHTQPGERRTSGTGDSHRRLSHEGLPSGSHGHLWPHRVPVGIDNDRWVSSTDGTPTTGTSRSHSPLHADAAAAPSQPIAVPPRHPARSERPTGPSPSATNNRSHQGSPSQGSAYQHPHHHQQPVVGSPSHVGSHPSSGGGAGGHHREHHSSPLHGSPHRDGHHPHSGSPHHTTQHGFHAASTGGAATSVGGAAGPSHNPFSALSHISALSHHEGVSAASHMLIAKGPPEGGGHGFTFGRGRALHSDAPPAAPGAPPATTTGTTASPFADISAAVAAEVAAAASPGGADPGEPDPRGPSFSDGSAEGASGSFDSGQQRVVSMLSLSALGGASPPAGGNPSSLVSRAAAAALSPEDVPAFPALPAPSLAPIMLVGFAPRRGTGSGGTLAEHDAPAAVTTTTTADAPAAASN